MSMGMTLCIGQERLLLSRKVMARMFNAIYYRMFHTSFLAFLLMNIGVGIVVVVVDKLTEERTQNNYHQLCFVLLDAEKMMCLRRKRPPQPGAYFVYNCDEDCTPQGRS